MRDFLYSIKIEGIVHSWFKRLDDWNQREECSQAFLMVIRTDRKAGRITRETWKVFRRLPDQDAALSLLDGAVTSLKAAASGSEDQAISRLIGVLEDTIDWRMKVAPGLVIPRNGKFAEAARKVGLDDFLK